MKKTISGLCALCVGFSLMGTLLGGCSTKAEVSKEEQENWKGGPMPPEFAQEIARKEREAQQKAQQGAPPQAPQ
jgi:hypothetical protein